MNQQEADWVNYMLNFIFENFLICITVVCVAWSFILSAKIKRIDAKTIHTYGKSFMEMPLQSRVRILFNVKWLRYMYAVIVILFTALFLCKLEKSFNIGISLLMSILCALMSAFMFLVFILVISATLRRLIAINSASLNVMFSSLILLFIMIGINLNLCDGLHTYEFIFTMACLVCCYFMMLFVLVMVLKEANDDESQLTLKNIWKSAFLTITLFLINLSMMSGCCYLNNAQSFKGVEHGLFDMLYYTVITFATVGYGDISPASLPAKAISILTVFTSILCITVLLSEIMGVKKKLKK